MRTSFPILTLLAVVCALPLFAQTPMTITPSSGPVTGGTIVTITGDFTWPGYAAIFDDVWVDAERIDDHTLRAVSPPHAAGEVKISIFEFDVFYETDLTFTYGAPGADAYERVLLPIFTPPVRGAFGSEFITALSMSIDSIPGGVTLFGLEPSCVFGCPGGPSPNLVLEGGQDVDFREVLYTGTPGRFFHVAKDQLPALSASLRVQDISRADLNYGTEIPIVRRDDFRRNRIILSGVPLHSNFRNTLRIYGDQPFWATVTVGNEAAVRVRVDGSSGLYVPSYGVFTAFPAGPATTRMTIDAEADFQTLLPVEIPFWAFVTVTNNDTQVISTITPQP